MALYSSKTTPIMQEYANRQTTKTDTVAKVGNSSINSIFNNKYSNGSTQANAPQESTAMSFTEKCAVVLTGLSVASAGISLAVAGKNLYDAFNPKDDKTPAAGANAGGAATSTVSSKSIDGAVDNAKASNNWAPVELLVSQSNTAILAKNQSITKLTTQKGSLETEIKGYQATIDGEGTAIESANTTLETSEEVADALYETETDGLDAKIADYEKTIKDPNATPEQKTAAKDAREGLVTKKETAEKKRTVTKDKATKTCDAAKKKIKDDVEAAKTAMEAKNTTLAEVKDKIVALDKEVTALTTSRDKAQAELVKGQRSTKPVAEAKPSGDDLNGNEVAMPSA